MSNEVKCPKCGSNQISAHKKGFSGKKAVAGAVLTGGVGLLAGTIGSNKIQITCLACGHIFKPGEEAKKAEQKKLEAEATKSPGFWIFLIIVFVLIIWALKSCG